MIWKFMKIGKKFVGVRKVQIVPEFPHIQEQGSAMK